LFRFLLASALLACATASASTINFQCLTANTANCSTNVAPYFNVSVNDLGSGQVQFLFSNSLPGSGVLTTAYIDEGDTNYFSSFAVNPTAGTSFGTITSGTLPGGNGNPYRFDTDFGADRTKKGGVSNGVDSGEVLDLRGTLNGGFTFANVIAGFGSATDRTGLRLGLHVQSLAGGASEGLISSGSITNAAVPEPGTYGMMALALGGLAFKLRKRA
jgi:hypothetical protein